MPDAKVQIGSLKEDARAISDTVALILEKVEPYDGRFDRIEARLSEHDGRFDRLETRLADHDGRFDRLETRLSEHDGRFDRIDGQLAEVLRRLPEPQ
jgi:hypothetical protein